MSQADQDFVPVVLSRQYWQSILSFIESQRQEGEKVERVIPIAEYIQTILDAQSAHVESDNQQITIALHEKSWKDLRSFLFRHHRQLGSDWDKWGKVVVGITQTAIYKAKAIQESLRGKTSLLKVSKTSAVWTAGVGTGLIVVGGVLMLVPVIGHGCQGPDYMIEVWPR